MAEAKDDRFYTPRQSSARGGSSDDSSWFSPRTSARSNSGHNSARSDSGDDGHEEARQADAERHG